MRRFIAPALPGETSEEEDVYELTHIDHLFIRDRIEIPGFGNYETLKCDFHTHTVFSDGLVWPDARIYEAWQEGLDAIAITDHIDFPDCPVAYKFCSPLPASPPSSGVHTNPCLPE